MLCGRHLKHKLYMKKYLEFNVGLDIHYSVTTVLLKAAMVTTIPPMSPYMLLRWSLDLF